MKAVAEYAGNKAQTLWFVRSVAVLAMVLLLAVAAPFIWAALAAGAGLVALTGMAAAGFFAFQTIPLAAQKLEHRILQLRKAEARRNPIEQLQNDCLHREQRLKDFRAALIAIGGHIETMREMVQDRKHAAPHFAMERQERAIQRMEHFYHANIGRLEEAHQALQAFRDQVKQKVFEWEFAQTGQVVMQALNPNEMNDLMQGLLSDEALRSVQNRFNMVFAELDVDMRAMQSPSRGHLAHADLSPLEALTVEHISAGRSRA